jgi:hypothetical protein
MTANPNVPANPGGGPARDRARASLIIGVWLFSLVGGVALIVWHPRWGAILTLAAIVTGVSYCVGLLIAGVVRLVRSHGRPGGLTPEPVDPQRAAKVFNVVVGLVFLAVITAIFTLVAIGAPRALPVGIGLAFVALAAPVFIVGIWQYYSPRGVAAAAFQRGDYPATLRALTNLMMRAGTDARKHNEARLSLADVHKFMGDVDQSLNLLAQIDEPSLSVIDRAMYHLLSVEDYLLAGRDTAAIARHIEVARLLGTFRIVDLLSCFWHISRGAAVAARRDLDAYHVAAAQQLPSGVHVTWGGSHGPVQTTFWRAMCEQALGDTVASRALFDEVLAFPYPCIYRARAEERVRMWTA